MLRAALLAGALLVAGQSAFADTSTLSADVLAKTTSPKEIAKSLNTSGTVNVIVQVRVTSGMSAASVSAALEEPGTRAAMKAEIAASIDAVVATVLPGIAASGRHFAKFSSTPGFAATLTEKELTALAADPRVIHIGYDLPVKSHLDQSTGFSGARLANNSGARGQGRTVAVLDQAVQRAHPFIGVARVAAEGCFLNVNECPNGTSEQTGAGAAEITSTVADHGTHVAGIVLGRQPAGNVGPTKGVALASRLIHITVLGNSGSGAFSNVQRGLEYLEDLVIAQPALRVAAFNMSLGGGLFSGHCDDNVTFSPLKTVIDRLRKRGVLGAISAGNDYVTNQMGAPGCISSVMSVASTSKSAAVAASYTSISAFTDIWAPGGEFGGCVESSIPTNAFAQFCGTSMASPHVAGAIAALKSAVPTANACQIEAALKLSGPMLTDGRTGGIHRKPRLRIDQALNYLNTLPAPANDNFANAGVIPPNLTGTAGVAYSTFGTNIGATMQVGEPAHVVATAQASIWWRWTPANSGPVTIDTRGTSTDTVLAVYVGGLSNLRRIRANNNEAAGVLTSKVTFDAVAGRTYRIAVAGRTATQTCSVQLNVSQTPPPPPAPANDNFADAIGIGMAGGSATRTGNNANATREPNEPAHRSTSDFTTVWWRFTALVTGPMVVDTEGSTFDTVLAVYTGGSLTNLALVGLDDDGGTGLQSRVAFNATAGTVYRVMVTGFGGASGNYTLNIGPAGP